MAKPILSPISVFDAAEGTTAYFKVAGAAVGKDTVFYLYEIYDSMTNLLVCTKSNQCRIYSVDSGYSYMIAPDTALINQSRNYTIRVKIKLSGESDYGEFSDPAILWCKERPVLSFDGLNSDSENLIPTSSIIFLLKYQ